MAVSCNCFLVSPCLFSDCFRSVTGGNTYAFSGGAVSRSVSITGSAASSFFIYTGSWDTVSRFTGPVCSAAVCCACISSSTDSSSDKSDPKSASNDDRSEVSSEKGSIPNAIAGSGRPGISNISSSSTVCETFGSSIWIGKDACSSSAAKSAVFSVRACPIASNASSENADGAIFCGAFPAVSVTRFSSLISGRSIISSGKISLISWERFCDVSGISLVSIATPSTFLSILRCCSRCSRSSLRISARSLCRSLLIFADSYTLRPPFCIPRNAERSVISTSEMISTITSIT